MVKTRIAGAMQVCTDLALAVVPELVGRVTLLKNGPSYCLSDPEALKEEMEAINKVK
jgi:hypothetical protein